MINSSKSTKWLVYRVGHIKLFQNECFPEVCVRTQTTYTAEFGARASIHPVLLLDMTYTLFLVLTICRAAVRRAVNIL